MMDRLTIRVDNGLDDIYFAVASDPEGEYNIHDLAQYRSENGDLLTFIADPFIADRLAEYEDTGLTPEEITGLKPLIDADKEGRAVILPCKVGDTVWIDKRTLPWNYLHPLDGCGDFAKCMVIGFSKTRQDTFMKMAALYPSRMHKRGYLRYGITAIGKTVFLTREEAEAALKGTAHD